MLQAPETLQDITSTVRLSNGVRMPRLGLGTYRLTQGGDVERSVTGALAIGYRSIDTASLYGNEEGIGEAVRASGIPRSELFITSKVGNSEQGYNSTFRAFDASLKRLGLEYLDLYLVHWPQPKTHETWRAMERLYAEGMVRAIGVCNHLEHHLEDLIARSEVVPMVDQYEFHPWLQQPSLLRYCFERDIVPEAWAPVMKGHVGEVSELVKIGLRHGKSPAQVAIRWILQLGLVTIPKSVHQERLVENADVFDFELSADEMDIIARLDRGYRFGPEPNRGGVR